MCRTAVNTLNSSEVIYLRSVASSFMARGRTRRAELGKQCPYTHASFQRDRPQGQKGFSTLPASVIKGSES